MKRVLAFILLVTICFSLCACFKSEEAKEVEALIDEIGKVTLDSLKDIENAEEAYDELTEDQKKEVENHKELTEARETFHKLEGEKAAAEVDAVIDAIGTVTLESGEKISNAREAYDQASENTKKYIAKLAVLTAAEAELTRLQEEEIKRQAAEVDRLIEAIGEVAVEKEKLILEAQEAYDALSDAAREKVTKADVLTAAAARYKELIKAEADQLMAGMTLETDQVRGLSFYYPEAFPYYTGYGYWAADIRSFVLPYMGKQGDRVWLRMVCHYTDDDWIFFEKVTFAVDDQRYYKYFNYYDISRDNEYGDVWETADIEVGAAEIELLEAIANSETTIVRFEGDDYYRDITISNRDKEAIKQMLTVYKALS